MTIVNRSKSEWRVVNILEASKFQWEEDKDDTDYYNLSLETPTEIHIIDNDDSILIFNGVNQVAELREGLSENVVWPILDKIVDAIINPSGKVFR